MYVCIIILYSHVISFLPLFLYFFLYLISFSFFCIYSFDKHREPTLLRFEGKPRDISPKAYWYHYILGYSLPFDRHDWFVQRTNGDVVRYVIDFYNGKAKEILTIPSESKNTTNNNTNNDTTQQQQVIEAPVSIHLDVRPALDSVDALIVRLKKYFFD